MYKSLTAMALVLAATSSQAHEILFSTTTYFTAAAALTQAQTDSDSALRPNTPFVVASSAQANGPGADQAVGNAVADRQFLFGSADVTSVEAQAHAAGTAEFTGAFIFPHASCPPGGSCADRLRLSLGFNSDQTQTAPGDAQATLFVTLVGDGGTLYAESFQTTFGSDIDIDIPAGLREGLLDLLVLATATADPGGTQFSLASVEFGLRSLPEPSSLGLAAAGMLSLVSLRRRQPNRK